MLPVYMVFRGLSAAASLKPAQAALVTARSPSLPRPQCRGLIEAAAGGGGHEPAHPLFRGVCAAASLKRHRDRRADGQGRPSSAASVPRPH